jgi:hypothetical protein
MVGSLGLGLTFEPVDAGLVVLCDRSVDWDPGLDPGTHR